MATINNQFLEWPFFDNAHRDFAARFEAWVAAHHDALDRLGVDGMGEGLEIGRAHV